MVRYLPVVAPCVALPVEVVAPYPEKSLSFAVTLLVVLRVKVLVALRRLVGVVMVLVQSSLGRRRDLAFGLRKAARPLEVVKRLLPRFWLLPPVFWLAWRIRQKIAALVEVAGIRVVARLFL